MPREDEIPPQDLDIEDDFASPGSAEGGIAGGGADIDDLNVTNAADPSLGLTDVPGKPSEDWATETGGTRTPEEKSHVATDNPADQSGTLGGERSGAD